MATSADSLEGAVDRNAKANLQGPTNFKRVPWVVIRSDMWNSTNTEVDKHYNHELGPEFRSCLAWTLNPNTFQDEKAYMKHRGAKPSICICCFPESYKPYSTAGIPTESLNEVARHPNNTVNDVARERTLHNRHHTSIPKYRVGEKESSILWDTGDSFPLKMSNIQIHWELLASLELPQSSW
jgi:hypothetical protein